MPDENPKAERERTNESLRAEREKADDSAGEASAIDDVADTIIRLARERADRVLAEARTGRDKADRRAQAVGAPVTGTAILAKERGAEDRSVQEARADADEILRAERAELADLLASERAETDRDLSVERASADDALATRDEFLGVVSHDLRNMLGSIVGFAGLIGESAQSEVHQEYARRITRAADRMNRLVGDLLDVASIDAGALTVTCEVHDPAVVVAEAVDTFRSQAEARKLSLVVEIAEPVPSVAFDGGRILQVLVNLLSNAFKFTPTGGRIMVDLQSVGEDLRFGVTDTGSGIATNQISAIFGRFYQGAVGDRRGAGLGLYISKCIVQGHGGRIWAESTVGVGSAFYFTIPKKQLTSIHP